MRVVVLPGMDGGAELSSRFRALLAAHYPVDAVEYPSREVSSLDTLEAQVRTVVASSEPTVLVAESFSGLVGMRIAAAPPANLRGVVLACTFVRSPVPRWWRWVAGPAHFARPPPTVAMRRWMLGESASEVSVRALRSAIARTSSVVLAQRARACIDADSVALLQAATVPLISIRATRDRFIPGRCAPEASREIPVHEVDAPHLAIHCAPEACAEIVRSALAAW